MNTNRIFDVTKRNAGQRMMIAIVGITTNVFLAFWMDRLNLPLFLDTIGTISVSAIAGLFPGIFTAVVTNALCALFNQNAIYYGFIHAFAAIYTVWFVRKFSFKKVINILGFILVIALGVGSISAFINWYLLDGPATARSSEAVGMFTVATGMPLFWGYFIYSILINVLDKGISTVIAIVLLTVIPDEKLKQWERAGWKQEPLSNDEMDILMNWGKEMHTTMRSRTTYLIVVSSLLLVIVTGWIGISMYFKSVKAEMTKNAYNSLRLVSELIKPGTIKSIITEGSSAAKYKETSDLLQTIMDSYGSVESISLTKFERNYARIIIGASVEPVPVDENGRLEYDEHILPHVTQLLNGENIAPVDHGTTTSWMRSVFYPIIDDRDNCICYAVADVSLTYTADYMKEFTIKSIIILLGFFILALASVLWVSNVNMVYPIRSMAKCVDDFSSKGYEQEQLDQNVRNIRALDIRTDDELEKLYQSICRMTLNLSEQMRDLRRLSDTTAKMQDGLIITMADMVENRDSDTGAHIQKTAAYVKIIVEGLKQKGYYAEKITPKFMSDVVRSAPLHDIGKINIPDGILNKPGKLTDEEYEIMKTHTTAGKRIMEDAISTVRGENYLKEARNMAAYHHERWDGKGYPEGLHGEVIPLSARIMAVADVFDALTSPRVYKPAMPFDKALAIITEGAGTQFDPKCVEAFMGSLPEVKVILKKYNKDV